MHRHPSPWTRCASLRESKRQFRLQLRPDDVLAEATWPGGPPTPETVQQALGQLVDWGNLQSQPDTARVATIEDFYRKRLLYRMTSGGEAVEAGLQAFVEALARRAELQSVALDDIRARLISLGQLMRESPPDAAKVHSALRDLVHVFVESPASGLLLAEVKQRGVAVGLSVGVRSLVPYFCRIYYYNRIPCGFDNPLLRHAERTLTTDSVSSCIIA
jgi:hypothetical protein